MDFAMLCGTEIYTCNFPLPPGMTESSKKKFAQAQQTAVFEKICGDFESGKIYSGDWKKGEIQLLRPLVIQVNRFWNEVVWEVLFPPRTKDADPIVGTYRWIEWNAGMDSGAAALCITEANEIILINSFRHASRAWRLEIPRGVRKQNESLDSCAFRESLEEAGIISTKKTKVIDLGTTEADSGLARMTPSLFALTNMQIDTFKIRRDVSEAIAGHTALRIEVVNQLILDGRLPDAYTNAALYRASLKGLLS